MLSIYFNGLALRVKGSMLNCYSNEIVRLSTVVGFKIILGNECKIESRFPCVWGLDYLNYVENCNRGEIVYLNLSPDLWL